MRGLLSSVLRIANEGWIVLGLLLLAVVLAVQSESWGIAIALVAMAVPAAIFFHDSPRHTIARPLGILAPADGVVSYRRECHDALLAREAIRIRIILPAFSNYLLRAPVEGELVALDRAPATVSCLRTDEGASILLAVTRGSLLGARPIWAGIGERVGQGRICGARRLAREIEVVLPADCRVEVSLGQTVRCGETVLATQLRRST